MEDQCHRRCPGPAGLVLQAHPAPAEQDGGAPRDQKILNQHSEGACTGFALAAAINYQYQLAGEPIRVSPRMLYEMARRFDEWPGEEYDGSSLRGAIKGWANMGVCEESFWPYRVTHKGDLTVRRAKNARSHTLGAYYRIEPDIVHYHAALNETGVIVVSAQVHSGWNEPEDGVIAHEKEVIGGHSFAVTGYDERGFWVQNSWGSGWGDEGLALWTYEDWIENVWDAWVFRLALPTPQIFGLRPQNATRPEEEAEYVRKVPRSAIAGHFVHVDDGHYKRSGRYWSTPFDVEETARLVAASEKYDHLLIYVHGGLNTPEDSAVRIDHMRDVFKANRIYPFHVMYDTGLVEELLDVIRRKEAAASGRVGAVSDWIDRFIEGLLRDPGTLLWEEMKRDACQAFAREGAAAPSIDSNPNKVPGLCARGCRHRCPGPFSRQPEEEGQEDGVAPGGAQYRWRGPGGIARHATAAPDPHRQLLSHGACLHGGVVRGELPAGAGR